MEAQIDIERVATGVEELRRLLAAPPHREEVYAHLIIRCQEQISAGEYCAAVEVVEEIEELLDLDLLQEERP